MDRATQKALEAQKNRAIATILEVKDQCDKHLPKPLSRQLRKSVLDAVNDLHKNSVLIVTAAEEGMTVNELLIDRLASRDVTGRTG